MPKIGRPQVQINWEEFDKLCGFHCTLTEIASWFRCSEDTIERAAKRHYNLPFAEVYRQKQSLGKISLRRKMYQTAMEGSIPMMIWLSKQLLGMSDKMDQKTELSGEVGGLPQVILLPPNGSEKKD